MAAEGRVPRSWSCEQRRLLGAFPRPGETPAKSFRCRRRPIRSHGCVTMALERDSLLRDLDAHQRAAVTDPHAPLAILAPAGSGKTRVLTRRIAFRVREQTAEARHVLAVTFTRRAAGELVDRLDSLGVDSAVTAGTFHALALA